MVERGDEIRLISARLASVENGAFMKKTGQRTNVRRSPDGMRREYAFRGGVRGKYASRYDKGTNVVLLAPDVAEEFPNARAVNRALREFLKLKSKRRTALRGVEADGDRKQFG